MNRTEAAQIIAQAAAALKTAKQSEHPADRVETAKRKVLMDGVQNEAATRNRAALSSSEFEAVVSVTAAQAELQRPQREPSPRHLDQSEVSSYLAQALDDLQN
jgi:hypothetical protein